MNKITGTMAGLIAMLFLPAVLHAQQQIRRAKVDEDSVRVGFRKVVVGSDRSGYKPGMWTPVVVTLTEHEQGSLHFPTEKDGSIKGEIQVEAPDSDGILTVYSQEFDFKPNGPMEIVTYTKVANAAPPVSKITLKVQGETFNVPVRGYFQPVALGHHIYLTLGDSLPELHDSLVKWANEGNPGKNPAPGNVNNNPGGDSRPRYAFYERDSQSLPAVWFGYHAVDMVVLVTSSGKFLDQFLGQRQASPELLALAEWVRRGGRLVVSIAPTQREKVQRLLSSPAWQPSLPPVLTPESKTFPLAILRDLSNWSGGPAFLPKFDKDGQAEERTGVVLQQNPGVVALAYEADPDGNGNHPLIVRFPYGLGSITLLAFDVKDPFLRDLTVQSKFWRAVVEKLAPVSKGNPDGGLESGQDLTSKLYVALESFDNTTISFGWVALFIFIYILVVGPLDYILLKLVFKRLELTWVTFPAVVLTVSLLAYFTAYAVKGQDLKVNKVDLLDIDMRSALGADFQPAGATVYGTSWFTIFSPRIQNYTIGLEPVLYNWQPGVAATEPPIEPTLSWLGRSDYFGMGAVGSRRSPGLFSRTYSYRAGATGLVGVPIPVWTTRSFTASWAAPVDKSSLPFESKLTYLTGKDNRAETLSGTLKNNLPFDLLEVCLVQGDRFFKLPNIKSGEAVKLKTPVDSPNLSSWLSSGPPADPTAPGSDDFNEKGKVFNPRPILRQLMFHEKVDLNHQLRNHTFRALDWSWRSGLYWRAGAEGGTGQIKEVILVARVAPARGQLQELEAGNDSRLATHLWLGALPGTPNGQTRKATGANGQVELIPAYEARPAVQGTLAQETYLRVILPVPPEK